MQDAADAFLGSIQDASGDFSVGEFMKFENQLTQLDGIRDVVPGLEGEGEIMFNDFETGPTSSQKGPDHLRG